MEFQEITSTTGRTRRPENHNLAPVHSTAAISSSYTTMEQGRARRSLHGALPREKSMQSLISSVIGSIQKSHSTLRSRNGVSFHAVQDGREIALAGEDLSAICRIAGALLLLPILPGTEQQSSQGVNKSTIVEYEVVGVSQALDRFNKALWLTQTRTQATKLDFRTWQAEMIDALDIFEY
jgi:hypothetical protein